MESRPQLKEFSKRENPIKFEHHEKKKMGFLFLSFFLFLFLKGRESEEKKGREEGPG